MDRFEWLLDGAAWSGGVARLTEVAGTLVPALGVWTFTTRKGSRAIVVPPQPTTAVEYIERLEKEKLP